eukprot:TRINITY_DN8184_c0_g1_i1.p1 TRINITY_DN8184_c0_g1~~TRINITY_DN8184_c0_g1_i1.p1  ORF type:complete len:403 (+),score=39.61 TRINITY_DN8184_c0_g1_i1:36-1211(+)
MAVDHCRQGVTTINTGNFEAFHFPTTFSNTSNYSYFVRGITHLAAPGFFYLMGVGIYMMWNSRVRKNWSNWRIFRHLAIRGGILIVLEFTVTKVGFLLVRSGTSPEFHFEGTKSNVPWFHWMVLAQLGLCMILTAALLPIYMHLRAKSKPHAYLFFLILAASLNLCTSLVTAQIPIQGNSWSDNELLALLFFPGGDVYFAVVYPTCNWLALTLVGAVIGDLLTPRENRAFIFTKILFYSSLASLALFPIVRMMGYVFTLELPKDYNFWKESAMAFFYVCKYPPSICFVMITAGVNNLVMIGWYHIERAERIRQSLIGRVIAFIFLTFGRSALFFYLLHLYIYAVLGMIDDDSGVIGLTGFWLVGLAVLLPCCHYYARFKHSTSPNSIWRFF